MKIRIVILRLDGQTRDAESTIYRRSSEAIKEARAFIAAEWEHRRGTHGKKARKSDLGSACTCYIEEHTIEGSAKGVAFLAVMLTGAQTIEANFGAEIDAAAKVTGKRTWEHENGRIVERREAVTP